MPDTVVGRERELEAAERLVSGLGRGAAALVFEGRPGIGKTTVLTEIVERSASHCVVLLARSAEAEAHLAYAGLADMLEPVVGGVVPHLPEPQRRAIAVALLQEDPGARRLDQRAVGAAVVSIVRSLAVNGPVLVAIDDAQWLDRASARVLEFAMRRVGAVPVGVVACERVDDRPVGSLNLGRSLPHGRCTRLRLQPLGAAALHRVLREQLGRVLPRRTVMRVQRAAAGNPFFALELARSIPESASTAAALPLPDSLRALVGDRLAVLPTPSRNVLLVAASLGSPTVEAVSWGASLPRADTVEALECAAAAGVIAFDGFGIAFTHPLFGEGLYSLSSAGERRALHARLAQVAEGVEDRARHLALAALPGTPDEQLAAVLDSAAEHARRRGAPDAAAELAEQARVVTPAEDAEKRVRRTIQAAEYHFHGGELRRARDLLETIVREAPSPSGSLRADCLRLLGEIRYHEDSFEEANRLFAEALEQPGVAVEVRSAVELRLAYGLNATGDFAASNVHGHRALGLAERGGEPALLAEALAAVAMVDAMAGRGIDDAKVARALQLEDHQRQIPVTLRPSLIAGYLALYAGQLERCMGILSDLRKRILERGQDSDLGFVSSNLVWAACWRGELEAAAVYADETLESASLIQSDSVRCFALGFGAVLAAWAGDAQLTRSRGEECLELAPLTSFRIAALWAGWPLAVLALSLEDHEAADEALGPLAAPFERGSLPEPARGFFIPDEVEALVGLGRLERAERLLGVFEDAAWRLQRPWAMMLAARCRALLLAARGDLEGASRAAREALALCDGLELRIEVARTLLVAGGLERRRRRKRAAADLLQQALAVFKAAGARGWEERARRELMRVGLRPSAPDELTPSERRVAELTASGLKNREVAARLFMSPKTVEATLGRVYRKLGIHSRAELGARVVVAGRTDVGKRPVSSARPSA